MDRCIVCRGRAVQLHHAVYRQWAKDLPDGMDINDPANLVPICKRDHERHHNATRRIPRSLLPPDTIEFFERAGLTHRLDRVYYESETT